MSSKAWKRPLTGSTEGNIPMLINSTSSTGAYTIHTATTSTAVGTCDEVWLYAYNNSTGAVTLTVEVGSTARPFSNTIASQSGWSQIVPGVPVNASVTVKGFASTVNVIQVWGWYNYVTD